MSIRLLSLLLATLIASVVFARPSDDDDDDVPTEVGVICRLMPGASAEAIAERYGLTLVDKATPSPFVLYSVLSDHQDQLEELLMVDPDIAWFEEDTELFAPEPGATGKGAVIPSVGDRKAVYAENKKVFDQIKWTSAMSRGTARTVRVAVLDTGLSPLANRLWTNVVYAFNSLEPGKAPNDLPVNGQPSLGAGHGTMVTGLIDAIAPNAKLIIGKVADHEGLATTWSLLKGIAIAAAANADVCNVSLGSVNELESLDDVIEWAYESEDMIVVAPIGNNALQMVTSPAVYDTVVCVAGVDPTDRKASFSNWESRADVAAPATGLKSVWWDGGMAVWSGTSFAAPLVTGALANGMSFRAPNRRWLDFPTTLKRAGDDINRVNTRYKSKLGRRLNVAKFVAQAQR